MSAPLPCCVYLCAWDSKLNRITRLESLGEMVYQDILDSLMDDPVLWKRFRNDYTAISDEFNEEKHAVEQTVEELTQNYILGSRLPIIERLRRHVENTSGNQIYCVTGESGTGKSALLAWFYKDLMNRSKEIAQNDIPIIAHFVGASPRSTDLSQMIYRLCREIAVLIDNHDEIPHDIESLTNFFLKLLQKKTLSQ